MQKRMITDRKDKNMLLVVDVGNTNITFGVYRDKELVTTFRLRVRLRVLQMNMEY